VSPLIGDAGVAAICARSLHLTQRQFPSLAPLRSSDQSDAPFTHLQVSLEQQEPTVATRAAVGVLTTAGDLLALFIGENLTTRLLREGRPARLRRAPRREPPPRPDRFPPRRGPTGVPGLDAVLGGGVPEFS